jgi:arabinose-5-phosphate isomerase
VIYEISSKKLGMTCVVDERDELVGVITDGDLRRHMSSGRDILSLTAGDVMTHGAISLGPEMLAVEALRVMEERKITAIVVVVGEDSRRVGGVVHLHDLWGTELV